MEVTPDTLPEPDEVFYVNLSHAQNGRLVDVQGQVTILGDDLPGLSIGNTGVIEPPAGQQTLAVFTVSIQDPIPGQTAHVSYAVQSGTATAGQNFVATSGTLDFPTGTTAQQVSVMVLGDSVPEGDENFTVHLSSPVNATIVDGDGVGTIFEGSVIVADGFESGSTSAWSSVVGN